MKGRGFESLRSRHYLPFANPLLVLFAKSLERDFCSGSLPSGAAKILRFAPSWLRHSLANLGNFEKKNFEAALQFFFAFSNFNLFDAFFEICFFTLYSIRL